MFQTSLQLGRILGVPIRLHWSFMLFLGCMMYLRYGSDYPWADVVRIASFLILLFGCVLLHELGHALMAKRFGVKTHHITLMPFGGMALLEGTPKRPIQEMWIAFAGPLANLLIAAALSVVLICTTEQGISFIGITEGIFDYRLHFFQLLVFVNMLLFVFNLFPIYPFDGWRMLRALLCMLFLREMATRMMLILSLIIGICLVFIGFYYQDKRLMLLGLFSLFMIRRGIATA